MTAMQIGFVIQQCIIGDKHGIAQHAFDNRMSAVLDVNDRRIFYLRTAILIQIRHFRQRAQHIGLCQRLRGNLNAVHRGGNLFPHLGKQLIFQICDAAPVPAGRYFRTA